MNALIGLAFMGLLLILAATIHHLVSNLPKTIKAASGEVEKLNNALYLRAVSVMTGQRGELDDAELVIKARNDQIEVLQHTILRMRMDDEDLMPQKDSAQDIVNDAEILSDADEKYTAEVCSLMDKQEADARQWCAAVQWVENNVQPTSLQGLGAFILGLIDKPVTVQPDDETKPHDIDTE